jgi:hypothetical protein
LVETRWKIHKTAENTFCYLSLCWIQRNHTSDFPFPSLSITFTTRNNPNDRTNNWITWRVPLYRAD